MALQAGIVGLPNVGKSTLFNALTNAKAQSANYPFCTIEPNTGVILVPDPRLDKLKELVVPQKVIPTTIEIVDIAGLVKGAAKGEGLGNKFLGNIRSVDAIIHVVRCFDDDNITHVHDRVNPVEDKEIIDTELQLKDLESVEKRIAKVERTAKSGDKEAKKEFDILSKVKAVLLEGKSARVADLDEDEWEAIEEIALLTAKPVMYVCNVDESSVLSGNAHTEALREAVKDENAEVILVCASIEEDIVSLDSLEDKMMFLEEMGLNEPGLNRVIRSAYDLLKLQTYFTAGVQEVRAWTITEGTKAPQAAGVIHTDFEKGFIRAEVIGYNDFEEFGSEAAVKEAGKLRVEGKEYIVQDGDVMHFRFNV